MSDNSLAIIDIAKVFSKEHLYPLARELDRENRFPEELLEEMAAAGFFGVQYPCEYGGLGLSSEVAMQVTVELAKASAGVALLFHVHWMAVDALLRFGSEEQKRKYLPPMLQGKKVAAYSISEVQAGSDASAIATTAQAVDNGWLLNGNKYFCTNGGIAELYFVACKTEPEQGAKGISMFVVEKGTPGFTIGPREEKMGCRSSATTSLSFKNCLIPKESILGKTNDGFKIAMYGLTGGRLGMAALGIGIAEAAFAAATDYARKRIVFGKSLANLYAIQDKVAEMHVSMQAARLLLSETARKRDMGMDYSLESSVAKIFVAEMVEKVCSASLQILGGHGYMKHQDVERYTRDARLLSIGVGASEVLKMVVGTTLLTKK